MFIVNLFVTKYFIFRLYYYIPPYNGLNASDRIEPEEVIERIKKPVSVLRQKGPQLVLTEKLPQTELIQKLLQLAVATVNIKTVFNALIYNKNFPLCKTEILVNLFYKGI